MIRSLVAVYTPCATHAAEINSSTDALGGC
jgi:hypothetical protein